MVNNQQVIVGNAEDITCDPETKECWMHVCVDGGNRFKVKCNGNIAKFVSNKMIPNDKIRVVGEAKTIGWHEHNGDIFYLNYLDAEEVNYLGKFHPAKDGQLFRGN